MADQIVIFENAGYHSGEPLGLKAGVQINTLRLDTSVRSVALRGGAFNGDATKNVNYHTPHFFNFDNKSDYSFGTNPPSDGTQVNFIDPKRYSDRHN